MAKEQIKVVLIETFKGEKYVLRLDREYEVALLQLLKSLFKDAPLGSVACISLRNMKDENYKKIPASQELHELEKKGIEDGKENKISKDAKS